MDSCLPIDQQIAANRLRRAECAEFETQITTLAGQINAMSYNFLKLPQAFDDKGGWGSMGSRPSPTGSTGSAVSARSPPSEQVRSAIPRSAP